MCFFAHNEPATQTLYQTQPGFKICISSASSSCPTSIQIRRILYHSPSMYHLTFIQVHRLSFHIHPGCVWIPSRPPRLTSHIHPGCVSPQSRSRYLHLTSIEVTSYLHPDPENCISSPIRSYLKTIPVLILTPSMLCFTYIDVQRHLVSPTSMYQLTIYPVQRLLSI